MSAAELGAAICAAIDHALADDDSRLALAEIARIIESHADGTRSEEQTIAALRAEMEVAYKDRTVWG